MNKCKLLFQSIWEIIVSMVVDLFTKDEETENERWLRERMDYANQQKTRKHGH